MVKDPTSIQPSKAPSRKWKPQPWLAWLGLVLVLLVVVAATAVWKLAAWPHSTQAVVALPTPSPTFVPKVGDADDVDDGVTVALGTIPTFQFKSGGYTLSGITVDAHTGKTVGGVSIWITLPPALGQRTAPELRSVSTLS